MAEKMIMVVLGERLGDRAVIDCIKSPTRSKVHGYVINYYNNNSITYHGPGSPIQPVEDGKFKDFLIDSFAVFPKQGTKPLCPRLYDEITFWVDPDYSIFIKDKKGISYKRDIEISSDEGSFRDFTSISSLYKMGRTYLGEVKRKKVDFAVIYQEDTGKTFICSKGRVHPVELPGIRLLKVKVRLNPTRTNRGIAEVDLVYAGSTTQSKTVTEEIITFKLSYTPKKKFGIF